jgi:predicted nuclease of predicted toxin-antitoxin system
MKITADEGIDKPIVDMLRAHQHEVYYIAEQTPSIADTDVLAIAVERGEILITQD